MLHGQVSFHRPVPAVDLAAGAGPFSELLRWRRRWRQQKLPGLEFRGSRGEAPVVSPGLLPPNASIDERDEALHFGFGFGFGFGFVHFIFYIYQAQEMLEVDLVVMCSNKYITM